MNGNPVMNIYTSDDAVELALTDQEVSMGLAQGTLDAVHRELEEADGRNKDGMIGRFVHFVTRTVDRFVTHRVSLPLERLDDASVQDGEIVFTAQGERVTAFDHVSVNDRRVLRSFKPEDAREFVTKFRALKARALEPGET